MLPQQAQQQQQQQQQPPPQAQQQAQQRQLQQAPYGAHPAQQGFQHHQQQPGGAQLSAAAAAAAWQQQGHFQQQQMPTRQAAGNTLPFRAQLAGVAALASNFGAMPQPLGAAGAGLPGHVWQQQPTAGAQQQQTAYAAAHAVAHAANAAAAQNPMPQTLQGAAPTRVRRGIGQLKASEPTRQLVLKRAAVGLSGAPLKKSIYTDPKWLFQLNVIKTGDFTVSKVRDQSSLAAARASSQPRRLPCAS